MGRWNVSNQNYIPFILSTEAQIQTLQKNSWAFVPQELLNNWKNWLGKFPDYTLVTFHQGVWLTLVLKSGTTLLVSAPKAPGYDWKAILSPNHFELSEVKLTFIPTVITVKSEKNRSTRSAKFAVEMNVALHQNARLGELQSGVSTLTQIHQLGLVPVQPLPYLAYWACDSQKTLEHGGQYQPLFVIILLRFHAKLSCILSLQT